MDGLGGDAPVEADVEEPGSPEREIVLRALSNPIQAHAVGPDEVLTAFLATLSPHTQRAYDGDLRDFARYLKIRDARQAVAAVLSAGPGAANAVALGYRTHLTARKLAPATIGRRLAAIRSVIKLARQLGQINWELEIPSPKAEAYRDTRGPGDDGWRAMAAVSREATAGSDPRAIRDLAILKVTHDLGLRVSELVGLDLADVEREGSRSSAVWILGKGRAHRERLTLPSSTAEALDGWLAIRGTEPGPVFYRLDAGAMGARTRLTDRSIRDLVGRVRKQAGVARHVTPHGLRHHAITRALDVTSGDVRKVQRFSRHKDLRTLTIYDDKRKDSAGEVSQLVSED